uniref:Uncharacterized protein n=1 Tax=Oryza brachyantha TaxID=4533 RepID=J3KU91_ORYBR
MDGSVRDGGGKRGADGVHRNLVEPLAEAHEYEEAEHGVPERLHHAGRRGVRAQTRDRELLDEHAANPGARRREETDTRRVSAMRLRRRRRHTGP